VAKRFFDSRKFDDPWYRGLPVKMKVVWEFLISKCDHAGIYKIDIDAMIFHIGDKTTLEEIFRHLGSRVYQVSEEKIFIPKFVLFQYGDITSERKVCASVRSLLEKELVSAEYSQNENISNCLELLGSYRVSKPIANSSVTIKAKDKTKTKVKSKSKDVEKYFIYNISEPIRIVLEREEELLAFFLEKMKTPEPTQKKWLDKNSPEDLVEELDNFKNWIEANGKKYKNYSAAFSNWLRSPYRKKGVNNGKTREKPGRFPSKQDWDSEPDTL